MNYPKLRYDGKWTWRPAEDQRQWTITTTYIDGDGNDRKMGSFNLKTLREIGLIPAETAERKVA